MLLREPASALCNVDRGGEKSSRESELEAITASTLLQHVFKPSPDWVLCWVKLKAPVKLVNTQHPAQHAWMRFDSRRRKTHLILVLVPFVPWKLESDETGLVDMMVESILDSVNVKIIWA